MTDTLPFPRHRPAPLHAQQPTPSGPERGGVRTARPHSAAPTPQAHAFQMQQTQFMALLQHQQQLVHQSQMIFQAQQAQQQHDADAALRAMRRRSAQDSMPRGVSEEQADRFIEARRQMQLEAAQAQAQAQLAQAQAQSRFLAAREENEETVRNNPLAASALARRKRQSLTTESLTATAAPTQRRVSYGGPFQPAQPAGEGQHHHRRNSSSASAQSLISDRRPVYTPPRLSPTSTDPPALILSKPGEAFPSTSNSTASSDGDDQPSTPISATADSPTNLRARRISVATKHTHGHTNSTSTSSTSSSTHAERSIAPWLAGVTEAGPSSPLEDGLPRRPSQAGSLAAALSGRRQRPVSAGGPMTVDTKSAGSFFPHQQQRSVSDASALSPFATTFQPLPITPFTPSPMDAYYAEQPVPRTPISARPPAPDGTATPIRQPRGPAVEAELSSSNFATRLRKSAISRLGVGRLSLGGAGL
ncbi:hypothetical protein RQP46_000300 [Phenoliferia psychrophenolica]